MRRTVPRVALVLLAILAIAAGVNLWVASSRFVAAYDAYDRLELTLSSFDYTSPEQPVATEFTVSNPSNERVTVREIELRLRLGVHDIGGGEVRPGVALTRGESLSVPVDLAIDDKNYVRQATEPLDWRVSGRVQVQLNPAIDPVWIPFVVRYLPE